MNCPDIQITDEVFRLFPALKVLTIIVNAHQLSECRLIRDPQTSQFLETPTSRISDIEEIRHWRLAYQKMSIRPSKYHSSIEALLRRAAKGKNIWHTGIGLVDFYNNISIRYRATIGAYDISSLQNKAIKLRALNPQTDTFDPIGQMKNYMIAMSVLGYVCENKIMCWALNHRDSATFYVRNDTSKILFVTEAISDTQYHSSLQAFNEIIRLCNLSNVMCTSLVIHDVNSPFGQYLKQ